jgi:hypothetical protein
LLIPVSSVVTRKTLGEFLLLKLSFEQYHEASWYLSVDSETHRSLQVFDNVTLLNNIQTDDGSHDTNDPEKNRIWMNLMMTKFDALRAAHRDHGYAFFLDTDIFFTAPLEERVVDAMRDPLIDAVLSLHMTNNPVIEGQYGYYNGGFFSVRNLELLEKHADMSRRHKELGLFYEQQPLQFASYPYLTVTVPINYNIGWWRFNEPHTRDRLQLLRADGTQIWFGDRPAVCFHAHTLKKLGAGNYGQFLVNAVRALMKACPNNSKYAEIIRFIDSYQQLD